MNVKAENMYMGLKCSAATKWFIFPDFPAPRPNSRTFQAWKIWILNSNVPEYVSTLSINCTGHYCPRLHWLADDPEELLTEYSTDWMSFFITLGLQRVSRLSCFAVHIRTYLSGTLLMWCYNWCLLFRPH